ncbi:MAG: DsbC family protein [Burkholderiales bacterium]|nr:DsbC family protein [Burkholderiales bacterium]
MPNLRHLLAAAVLACAVPFAGHAQDAARDAAKDAPRIGGPEANIKRILESRMRPGTVVDAVTRTPFFGLFEVRVGSEIVYTDEKVTYLFHGSVLDGKTMDNLTQERIDKLSAIRFDDLPVASAIKLVNGSGKRKVAYFADPNCGYCKKFERETLNRLPDATIYIYLYPILSPDSVVKSKAVWCSQDKLKAWNDWMLKGQPPSAQGTCDNPIEALQALGKRMRVNATPTIFLANGRRVPGAISLAQLEAAVAEAGK